jgi:hypothetical protein
MKYKILTYHDGWIDVKGMPIGRYLAVRKIYYGWTIDHVPTGSSLAGLMDIRKQAIKLACIVDQYFDMNIAVRRGITDAGYRFWKVQQDILAGRFIDAGRHAGI